MALNKKFKDPGKFYDKLGYNNADALVQAMAKSPDYYYIGFLTQVGVDVPTSEVFYSDLLSENGITFTYESTGIYRMYCNLFKPGQVEVEVNEGQNNSPASSVVLATVYDGYVEFTALDGGTPMDDVLYKTPVKVKVWTNAGIQALVPPAVPQSMWYAMFSDPDGAAFAPMSQDWTLEGDLLFNSQSVLSAAPYSGNGISNQVFDPFDGICTGCTWRIYTIEDVGAFASIAWAGVNGSGVPYNVNFIEVTSKKSFTGQIIGSTSIILYMTSLEFNDITNFPVDLSDPYGPTALQALMQYYFGTQTSVDVVENGPLDYTVTISDIYTNGTTLDLIMSDSAVITLNETP